MTSPIKEIVRKPHIWCFTSYFAEGAPLYFVRSLASAHFTDVGAKERHIGYLNFLGIPWNLKFLWAPLVDLVSSKKRWLVTMQLLIAALMLVIALVNFVVPETARPLPWLLAMAVLLACVAFLSATNDIATDAYYMEGLPEKRDQAALSGYRVLAYRMSLVYVRTGMLALVALVAARWPSTNKFTPWTSAFAVVALTMLLLSLYHAYSLDHLPVKTTHRSILELLRSFVLAFGSYFRQPKIVLILAFLLVYKLGDEVMFSMVTPFLQRELGLTKLQFAWVSGLAGAGGNIAGAMLGGYWIRRWTLRRAIWPITVFMNLNIWAYIALAHFRPQATSVTGIALIAAVHGYEQFAAGLGSSALLLFLLTTCGAEFKAAHYAIGSALTSVCSHLFSGFGGVIVEHIGYLNLYLIAFAASLPALVLLCFVPIKDAH